MFAIQLCFLFFTKLLVNVETKEDAGFECGVVDQIPPTFIVDQPSVGSWPWMSSLGYYNEKDEWIHLCGATLVHQHYFLTAAHCAQEIPPNCQILAGVDDFKVVKSNKHATEFNIEEKLVHKNFDGKAYFDIALLRTQKVTYTERIRPICLPELSNDDESKYDNDLMDVTGWGSSSVTGATSTYLKRVSVKVYPQRFCNSTHMIGKEHPLYKPKKNVERSIPMLFQSQIMCAGQPNGRHGSCKGDSGGPLFFHNLESNNFIQVGVVHGGVDECGSTIFPGIYVRLDDPQIYQFIRSIILGETNIHQSTKPPNLRNVIQDYLDEKPPSKNGTIFVNLNNRDDVWKVVFKEVFGKF